MGDTDLQASHGSGVQQLRLWRNSVTAAPGTPPSRALQLEVCFPGAKANTAGIGLKAAARQRALAWHPAPRRRGTGMGETTVVQQEWGALAIPQCP